MARPRLGYLFFDLPSDHEVEGALATECDAIYALIQGRNDIASRVKLVRIASLERFMRHPRYQYDVQFVHLACHGTRHGIGMLGDTVRWRRAAEQIVRYLRPLRRNERRVICFSCCFSSDGVTATDDAFEEYFSGAYHFVEDEVPFSDSITVWSMFYLKKRLRNPHGAMTLVVCQSVYWKEYYCILSVLE